jgi:hypothetical protein
VTWKPWTSLHARLVALQSDEEIERKATKATHRGKWTVEELDSVDRRAQRLHARLRAAARRQGQEVLE